MYVYIIVNDWYSQKWYRPIPNIRWDLAEYSADNCSKNQPNIMANDLWFIKQMSSTYVAHIHVHFLCFLKRYKLILKLNTSFSKIGPKICPKTGQKRPFYVIFCYRRIGKLSRIFGTEYSANFGRIFGIRSYTSRYIPI